MPRANHQGPGAWLALAAAALIGGCKPATPEPQPRKVPADPAGAGTGAGALDPSGPTQPLRAAGVELRLPTDWAVLASDDPGFALATAPERRAAQVPTCTIELRRQGLAELPADVEPVAGREAEWEYRRGALLGQFRALARPDGAVVVVHCQGPRSSTRWREISDAMATITEVGPAPAQPAPFSPGPSSVVELCTSGPARMGMVCARRHDGAVYCGLTTADTLERIALPEPAAQISCNRAVVCARSDAGAVHCWRSDVRQPEPIAGVEGARDIVDGLIVTGAGELVTLSQAGLTELLPLDDAALALTGVEQVLAGTTAASGCVLREGSLWCWGDGHGEPEAIAELPGARDLVRLGDRICADVDGGWTCVDEARQRHSVARCGERPCGCSLVGAARFSCAEAPFAPLEPRPLGRITDVVAIGEPCVALADGRLVCRGPGPGQVAADHGPVASDAPGLAHALTLR